MKSPRGWVPASLLFEVGSTVSVRIARRAVGARACVDVEAEAALEGVEQAIAIGVGPRSDLVLIKKVERRPCASETVPTSPMGPAWIAGGSREQAVNLRSPAVWSQTPPPASESSVDALPPSPVRSMTTRRPVLVGFAAGMAVTTTRAVLRRGKGATLNVIHGSDGGSVFKTSM